MEQKKGGFISVRSVRNLDPVFWQVWTGSTTIERGSPTAPPLGLLEPGQKSFYQPFQQSKYQEAWIYKKAKIYFSFAQFSIVIFFCRSKICWYVWSFYTFFRGLHSPAVEEEIHTIEPFFFPCTIIYYLMYVTSSYIKLGKTSWTCSSITSSLF